MCGTDGVVAAEHEFEAVGLVLVNGVVIQHFDVHEPLLQVLC